MVSISELVKALVEITKGISTLKGARAKARLTFFDANIRPPYELLRTIHKDYLETFCELQTRLMSPDGISSDTMLWLGRARARYQADRSELRVLELPWPTAPTSRFGLRNVPYYVEDDYANAAKRFTDAVQAYFGKHENSALFVLRDNYRLAQSFIAQPEHVIQRRLVRWFNGESDDTLEVLASNAELERLRGRISVERLMIACSAGLVPSGTIAKALEGREIDRLSEADARQLHHDAILPMLSGSTAIADIPRAVPDEWRQLMAEQDQLAIDLKNPAWWTRSIAAELEKVMRDLELKLKDVQETYMKLKVQNEP